MSAISNVGSSSTLQILQQLSSRQSSGPQASSGFPQPSAEVKAQFESAAQRAGIDTAQFSELRGQIDSAIQGAVKGLDGSTDPQAAIESAINGVLEENGIDAQDFKSKLESVFTELGVPSPGSFGASGVYGKPASNSATYSSDQSQSDLLKALFGNDEDSESDSSGSSIAQAIRNLPVGSLYDAEA